MLSYTEFKEEFLGSFIKKLPKPYCEAEIEIKEYLRVSEEKEGIFFKDVISSPIFYLNDIYEYYKESTMEETVEFFVGFFKKGLEKMPNIPDEITSEKIYENVFFQVINKEKNKELLKEVPHRIFLDDYAVIYRICVQLDDDGITTAIIRNKLNDNEEELYAHAYENTRKLFPVQIKPIYGTPSIVLSNTTATMGAAYMLYPDIVKEVAELIGRDMYMIPSSVHELIFIPADDDYEELVKIIAVANSNADLISPNEVLGTRPHLYNYKAAEFVEAEL